VISGFGVWYEDNKTFDARDSFTAATDLLDVDIVFFAFFDRFRSESVRTGTTAIASPFITHSIFHLRSSFHPFRSVATGESSSRRFVTAAGRSPASQPDDRKVDTSEYKHAFVAARKET
jgi:hypothetical protein